MACGLRFRKPELLALFDPAERKLAGQFLKGQICRLSPLEYRFDNIRSQKSAPQDSTDIPVGEAKPVCDRNLARNFSVDDPLVPLMSPCDRFQER